MAGPQSTYRSFVGAAKDAINANLSAGVAAAATSLTLRNIVGGAGTLTTAGISYSAIIIDGTLTETVACSGNATGTVDGSTIAVGALANAHSAQAYVMFQLTASIGPTAYIPLTDIDFGDDIVQLPDDNVRGSNVKTFDVVQGLRHNAFVIGGSIFADTFGYVLSSFFGAYDYTATAGNLPTTYAFSPLNTGNAQPTPYAFYNYNPGGNNTRVVAGSKVEQIHMKVDPGALATFQANVQGFASGVVANPATIPPVFSAFTAVPSRVGIMTVGGSTIYLLAFEATLKRDQFEMPPVIQGIQDPLAPFSGPAEITGKMTVVATGDDVQLLNYLQGSKPAVTLTLTQGATTAANGVKIQMTKCNFITPTKYLQKGKAFVQLEIPFEGLANVTDASVAGAGRSPALITLSTGTTTGASLY